MLVKLNLENKAKFVYKIKSEKIHKNNKTVFVITAPTPKNKKQKNKLIEFLTPYENYIIYPKGFDSDNYPAPYPMFELHCKKLLADFLNLCKKKQPEIAVITPNGAIKNEFYFDLSEYVGKIIINDKNENKDLKNALLAHSGTVIEFVLNYENNLKNTEYLYMPKKKLFQ
ncbi:MAG: hypothetical protein J6B88_01255 [Clostridia bacterium]|nr:hypothetical protein [Clostridia bacterium]